MADQIALDLLLNDKLFEFNNLVDSQSGKVDLSEANLRARDLRSFKIKKANFKNAYLRLTDLRGIDLTQVDLEGASIRDAKVSGTLFPKNLDAQEIFMSLRYGTRMRIKA